MEKSEENKEIEKPKDEKSDERKAEPAKLQQVKFTPDLKSHTTTLKLCYQELNDWIFAAILNRLPMLAVLDLINFKKIVATENYNPLKIRTQALQTLNMENSDMQLLTFMETANLQYFKIKTKSLKENEILDEFLTNCKSLIKLKIKAIDCDLMDFFTESEFPFRLKHLALSSTLTTKKKSYDNERDAIKFLSNHCTPLTILELRAPLPDPVVDCALKTFRAQRVITMRLDLLPVDEDFFRPVKGKKPKRSVKQLTLEGPYNNFQQIEGILKLYPAIQALQFSDTFTYITNETTTAVLHSVSKNCNNLYELSIPKLPALPGFQPMRFKSLVILKLHYINSVNDLAWMLKISPHLKTLHLQLFRKQTSPELIKEILSHNIRDLYITADPTEIIEFYNRISEIEVGRLQKLEMRTEDLNYSKVYQFSYRDMTEVAVKNRDEEASRMFQDITDYLMLELLKNLGEAQITDSAVIDYALDAFGAD